MTTSLGCLRRAIIFPLIIVPISASAHDWHRHSNDQHDHQKSVSSATNENTWTTLAPRSELNVVSRNGDNFNIATVRKTSAYIPTSLFPSAAMDDQPDIARHFQHFKNVKVRWTARTLFVESNGLPDHNMMVGIRSWQQQVPLPQPFTGNNAWQIPLQPKLAAKPISAKTNLFRGAIALAVNGVPIFNALNNRGEDAYLAGELDQWGGHCGRGDDYHYHMAPVHLQSVVGDGQPIAFALDGFPIYGLTEADGSPVGKLDALNGQFDKDGKYHYHATKTYPYINGGLRGVVEVRSGQVDPQPKDSPVRPALSPLRGATITGFKTTGAKSVLTYQLGSQSGTVSYSPAGASEFQFSYREPNGKTWSETYQRRSRGNQGGPDGRRPPPQRRPRQ